MSSSTSRRLLLLAYSSSTRPVPTLAFHPSLPRSSRHRLPRSFATMVDGPAPAPAAACVPCESLDQSHLLPPAQVDEELAGMEMWRRKGANKIARAYVARNFQCALDSLAAIGRIAEREGHHPDLHLRNYREVEVVLYTHSLDGITANDLALAKMIDAEVAFGYSPKWLKSHLEAEKEK